METVVCELCHSASSRVAVRQRDLAHGVSDEEFTVVRCQGCGLLYLNPRPSPSEIGRYYPPQYYPAAPPRPRPKIEQLLKRFSWKIKCWIMEDFYGYPAATPRNGWGFLRKVLLWPEYAKRVFRGRHILPWIGQGRLLDVGCGAGGNLVALRKQGWNVCGLDASAVAVTRAREVVGDRVQLGDLGRVRYQDQAFDVVLFSHSLEHMYDPLAVLKEVRRILDEKGQVVITLPNAGSLEAKLFGRWWFQWDLPRHLYHFDKARLSLLLEKAGFRVMRMRTGVGSPYFIESLDRAWTHRFHQKLPARRLLETLIARPFCLLTGHLGYGTEITVHAVKA